MNSAALRPSTAEPAATATRNSLPEAPAVSAAPRAAGRIAIPGWVRMRNVSHLPPAKIISALTKAGPALAELPPVPQPGRCPAPAGLRFLHQRQGLPAPRRLVGDESRG